MEYNPTAQVATLTVLRPDSGDAGRYRLEASNQHGQTDTTGRVTINGTFLFLSRN